ncbi:MAG: hypothetical protein LAT53_05775 [Idiomarina sp.]|nr:hypothetical protein [Idiomarina sp.]
MLKTNKLRALLIAVFLIALTTVAILWNSAREEIFFLCGNFSEGVEKVSVVRQLDTANLSSYEQVATEYGSEIVFSSKLNLGVYQCIIEFDGNNRVIRATFT